VRTISIFNIIVRRRGADIQKYKVYRDTPLPDDNKSLKPTVTAQEKDVHKILGGSSDNTREKESSAAKLPLQQQTSIRNEGKEEDTAKVPVKTTTKAKTEAAAIATTTIPRSNYTTINKVQQEEIQQAGPITATTTTAAELPKLPMGLRFPADKNKIVQFVQQQSKTNPDCQKMVPLLQRIENRQYENVSDVTKTAGLVE
jgi:hypothetical protein